MAVQSKHPLPNLPRRNPVMRKRADLVLVEKKIAQSRQQARHLIMQSAISVAGTLITKPGQLIDSDAPIEISAQGPRWVGRGGEKLARAFQMFALPDCKNIIAADIGASTGGFCDVLLSRGAGRIYAVDVGHGQLAAKLAQDSRIINLEQLNAKDITSSHIPELLDIVVCDLSFISVTKALSPVLGLVRQGGHLVCLVKPQFEAGRQMVGKKGVVKSPVAYHQAIEIVTSFIDGLESWQCTGLASSPITGAEGNQEFLLHAVLTGRDSV